MDLRPIYKIGSSIALTVLWFVLINHSFRTIFLEYIVILPLLLIFSRKYFKITVIVLVLTFILGIMINLGFKEFVLSKSLSNIESPEELLRLGFSGRLPLWAEAFRIGLELPLRGIGQ